MSPPVVTRPSFPAVDSVNQRAPSAPTAIQAGLASGVGTEYSVMCPAVVIRPMAFARCSVNQRAPSGPATIGPGPLPGVGVWKSSTAPCTVIRPTTSLDVPGVVWEADPSVNQMLPSGPATNPKGSRPGTGNSV